MTEFFSPVDIGNRALQHLTAPLLDPVLGFSENTDRALHISTAYGKVRRAELQRNTWRFATKMAVLRGLDPNTLRLVPALWMVGTTYFRGSVVSDQNNNLWISRTPSNLGNQPLTSTTWDPYYGPLSVMLYDSSQTYREGELVYTAAGDGTYNVYLSRTELNAVHPALPNQWSATTTYFKNQVVQQFPAWSSLTTYAAGNGVLYTDGNLYVSLVAGNLNHIPPSSGAQWALMPALTLTSPTVPANLSTSTPPTTSPVLEWLPTQAYVVGNVVMFNGLEWVCTTANTGVYPTAADWAQVTSGTLYMSLTDLNIGNSPATTFIAAWAVGTTYASGNTVTGSDGIVYSSVGSGNVGHDPTTDGGVNWTNTGKLSPWQTGFALGGGNPMWVQIGGSAFPGGVALTTFDIVSPLGDGPYPQEGIRNIFRLPAGFLRPAPRDAKAGQFSWLGAPSNLYYPDWIYRGDYIISRDSSPIVFAFIADVTDVAKMDDLFCEMLAASLAGEVCEPLTQSTAKKQECVRAYKDRKAEAITVNAIIIGSEEPPLDDFIACRA